MADLGFRDLTKAFPGGTMAVDSLDLEIADGEFMVFVGPSGSGKTTVLRLTAGLEEVTRGDISIGGEVVNQLHPMDRDIAMVFQNYALYPHMTVSENMGFGLKLRHTPKKEIKERVGQGRAHARHLRAPEAQAGPAVRRPAPARRHGSRDRARAGRVPDGRAALEPRREAPRPDARRDPEHPAPARDDHDLRHARPDRGDDDGRPRRRHAPGQARAGRHAAGALRPAGRPVRRRLHRLARDEPRPRAPAPVERLDARRVRLPLAGAACENAPRVGCGARRPRRDPRDPPRAPAGRRARRPAEREAPCSRPRSRSPSPSAPR